MLLGETAEARGFKPKPAEPQPVGMSQDEEFWNTYQSVQEQLSRNTHKEAEPVCERGKELHGNFFLLGPVTIVCLDKTSCPFSGGPALWICKYSLVSNYDMPAPLKVVLE